MKKVIQIFLALFLSFIIVNCVDYIILNVTPTLDEKAVAAFNKNKEKFETVRNYMLTQNEGFSLTYKDYKVKAQNESVKSDLEFIFTEMNAGSITLENSNIRFYCCPRVNFSFEIIYKDSINNLPSYSELGDSWYYSSFVSDTNFEFITPYNRSVKLLYNRPVKLLLFFCFIILCGGLYLILGKIPPFKKRKLPSDI